MPLYYSRDGDRVVLPLFRVRGNTGGSIKYPITAAVRIDSIR